jgi:outer membrane protein TolC
VARARAKPEWMFELETMWMYTKEGDFESDSLSAFVVVDLPFFKKNLQDRWLAASEKDYTAALFLAADEKRDLKRMLDQEFANWTRFDERLSYYKDVVLPQASQNAQAALRAYQAQVVEFTQLMRARQMELDSKLEALRMLVERAMAQTELLYLAGEGI